MLATTPSSSSTLSFRSCVGKHDGHRNLKRHKHRRSEQLTGGHVSTAGGQFGTERYVHVRALRRRSNSQPAVQLYACQQRNRHPNDYRCQQRRQFDGYTFRPCVAPVQSVSVGGSLARIGTTGAATITVTNVGNGNLSGLGDMSNLKGTASSSSGIFTGPGGSVNLGDSGAQTFSYAYTPTDRTVQSTSVSIQFTNGSSDGTNQAQTVSSTLTGQGVGPIYQSVSPVGSTLSFGDVMQGISTSFLLHITNATVDNNGGNAALTDLTLLSVGIVPDANSDGLFTAASFSPGTVIHEGGSLDLEIDYNGTGTLGEKSASLSILTDEGAALGANGNSFNYLITANVIPIPEPSAAVLLGAGAVCLLTLSPADGANESFRGDGSI